MPPPSKNSLVLIRRKGFDKSFLHRAIRILPGDNFVGIRSDNQLLRQGLGCCTILGLMEVRFPKWFLRVKKGVINLFLCISMAYNVISCIEIAKNTQTLKIADFTM